MKVPPRIRAVSFDVGGTLIEPWPSVGHVYAEIAALCGCPPIAPALLNEQFAAAWKMRGAFDYSPQSWRQIVSRTFASAAAEFEITQSVFDRIYERFVEAAAWRVFDDVLPALTLLRERGCRLAVVSNWDARLRPLLRNLNLDSCFESIVISGEVGHHKPAPAIFQQLLGGLQLRAVEVLHVGDNPREDFQGAVSVGMRSVLLQRGKASPGENEVASLAGLLPWMEAFATA